MMLLRTRCADTCLSPCCHFISGCVCARDCRAIEWPCVQLSEGPTDFPAVSAPLRVPPAVCEGSSFPALSPTPVFHFCVKRHLNDCEVASHGVLICSFLIISDIKHLFMCFHSPCVYLLWRAVCLSPLTMFSPSLPFAHFSIGFLLLLSCGALFMFWILNLIRYMTCKYFLLYWVIFSLS